jgi:LemA protein
MEYIVFLVGIGLLVFYLIALYNRLVALHQTRKNSFSDIDVQLKLRHDLIPNLVESVSTYLKHEKEVLENVTTARSNAMKASTIEQKSSAESALDSALMKLFAVSEAYPELKADNTFNRFQAEISAVERTIAAARRFFNNATAEFNTATMQFPSNIFAKIFGFHEESYFELSSEQKAEAEKPFKVKF